MSAVPALKIDNIGKHFGGVKVIDQLSFSVPLGARTALIGPNGAGKTTVFNLVSGVYPLDYGSIALNGADVTHVSQGERIKFGLARSFQNIRLIAHLTALENILLGQQIRAGGLRGLLYPLNVFRRNKWRDEARAALCDVGLEAYGDDMVGDLPYGVQKRIDLVRAELARPKLLLLDEPAAGLNPTETEELQAHLEGLTERGITLVVVEHDMQFINVLCEHVVVLNFGSKIAEGTPEEVRNHGAVREAYLGREEDEEAFSHAS